MKLAKKMLASALALAMVAVLALTAFAADSKVVFTSGDAVVGENVVVTMSATGMAGLEAADMTFTYDAEILEFVSIKKAADATYDMGVGGLKEAGTIKWSFIYSEAAEVDSAIAVITFKVLKEGDANLTVSFKSWDGADAPAADSLSTVIKAAEAETEAPETEAPETEAPETEAPETEAPETEAPAADETEAPAADETEAPAADETTAAADETEAATVTTSAGITQTGEASVAAIAGVMALAAVAFVATRKKDEE